MLRHRLCTTSLKARKKRGAKGVPQSPALVLVPKPKPGKEKKPAVKKAKTK